MSTDLKMLAPGLREARARRESLVLATVVSTEGSTYRKAGARMLLAPDGRGWGLLGGGCFEGDLLERAARVAKDDVAAIVAYDLRGDDDLVWGLGAGCEGLSRILLQPVCGANGYQPLAALVDLVERRDTALLVTVLESPDPVLAVGDAALASADGATVLRGTGAAATQLAAESVRRFGARKAGVVNGDRLNASLLALAEFGKTEEGGTNRVERAGEAPDEADQTDDAERCGAVP